MQATQSFIARKKKRRKNRVDPHSQTLHKTPSACTWLNEPKNSQFSPTTPRSVTIHAPDKSTYFTDNPVIPLRSRSGTQAPKCHSVSLTFNNGLQKVPSKGKLVTAQRATSQGNQKSISLTHRSLSCETSSLQHYQALIECIRFLTSSKGFVDEGILRVCGNFDAVQKVKEKITQGAAINYRTSLKEIGVYGTADLFKSLLKTQESTIFSSCCFEKMDVVSSCDFSTENCKWTPEELTCVYLNAVLCYFLSVESYNLLSFTLGFLRLVVSHEEQSKMSYDSIATLFAPILFYPSNCSSVDAYMMENNRKIGLLIQMMDLFGKHTDLFTHKTISPLRTIFAKKSTEIQSGFIIIGEEVTIFHEEENLVYGIHQQEVFTISKAECTKLFADAPPNHKGVQKLLRNSRTGIRKFSRSYKF